MVNRYEKDGDRESDDLVQPDTGGRTARQTAARETDHRLGGSLDQDGSITDDRRFHVIEKVGGRLVADSIAMDIAGGQSTAPGERTDRVIETSDRRCDGGSSVSSSALRQDATPEGEGGRSAAGRVLDDETRTVDGEAGGSQQKGGDRLTAGGTRPTESWSSSDKVWVYRHG